MWLITAIRSVMTVKRMSANPNLSTVSFTKCINYIVIVVYLTAVPSTMFLYETRTGVIMFGIVYVRPI